MSTDAMRPLSTTPSGSTARLGASLHVKGEISGNEDLHIDGSVEGLVQLEDRKLTVGASAKLTADVVAREVVVYGSVKGNLRARDRIEIKKDGSVVGDLTTARIMIEDGAYFKGSIEIDRTGSSSSDNDLDKPAYTRTASGSTATTPAHASRQSPPAKRGFQRPPAVPRSDALHRAAIGVPPCGAFITLVCFASAHRTWRSSPLPAQFSRTSLALTKPPHTHISSTFDYSWKGVTEHMRTYVPRGRDTEKIEQGGGWFVLDAAGLVMGRVATRIARILIGKDKANYTPYLDCGDHVVVINADKIRLTGNKLEQKIYRHHSGFPGGLKEVPAKRLRPTRADWMLREAVLGMLPKNKLRALRAKKLRIYLDDKVWHATRGKNHKRLLFNL